MFLNTVKLIPQNYYYGGLFDYFLDQNITIKTSPRSIQSDAIKLNISKRCLNGYILIQKVSCDNFPGV